MTFTEAAAFRLWFGIHKGKTLDEIGTSDTGLRYLDWLRGERERRVGGVSDRPDLDDALNAYLDDQTIAGDVAKLAKGGGA